MPPGWQRRGLRPRPAKPWWWSWRLKSPTQCSPEQPRLTTVRVAWLNSEYRKPARVPQWLQRERPAFSSRRLYMHVEKCDERGSSFARVACVDGCSCPYYELPLRHHSYIPRFSFESGAEHSEAFLFWSGLRSANRARMTANVYSPGLSYACLPKSSRCSSSHTEDGGNNARDAVC